jgi:nucleotide-binding universal stress UspA family protein
VKYSHKYPYVATSIPYAKGARDAGVRTDTRIPQQAAEIPRVKSSRRVLKDTLVKRELQEIAMYSKILVPIDGSETSFCGLHEAIKIAKSQGSQIRLLHIVNEFMFDYTYSPGIYASNVLEALRESGRKVVNDAEAMLRQQGIEPGSVMLETIGGPAADLILEQAKQWPADLIVMGTHGRRGIARVAMGSDAEEVVRASPVPVLLVRGIDAKRNPADRDAVAA